MKKQRSLRKDILFISVSSFIVTSAWIGFNVFHSHVTTTITPELQVQIVPITPVFDTALIEKLKTRTPVQPISGLSGRVAATPTPTPAISPGIPTGVLQPSPSVRPSPSTTPDEEDDLLIPPDTDSLGPGTTTEE